MTTEEAIKILEVAKAETEWTAPLDYHEAFDIAIKALQNSPTQMSETSGSDTNVGTNDLISRQAAIKDAESWVAVDEYEKHLQKNVVEWLKEFPSAEHGTNLAGVGTDVPDINVGELISRQAAIDAARESGKKIPTLAIRTMEAIKSLPATDVVPVVRCKDCIHWMPHTQLGRDEDDDEYHDYCARLVPEDEYYAFPRDADDFCSRAKRKEMANDSD